VTRVVQLLESNYQVIRDEYQNVAHNLWSDYQSDTEHHTLHHGKWDWHTYMSKGRLQGTFAAHFVQTSQILQQLRDANLLFEGVPFGYAFFSTLHANSRIAPHHGPMNFRLRVHLPLVVPEMTPATATADGERTQRSSAVGINVGGIEQRWEEGSALVLDDSYVHHVWNDTMQARVILLVDIWHPDLSRHERQEIVQLFQHAADQGWWSPPAEP
jgi:aspartyl/asparaginyl beta-hydroxylase (cupin superfamily)